MRLMIIAGMCLALGACATKTYPIATPLSAVEQSKLTCDELLIEQSKTSEMRAQIAEISEINWRSGLAFGNDLGIGNWMAKNEADEALAAREESIIQAQLEQGC